MHLAVRELFSELFFLFFSHTQVHVHSPWLHTIDPGLRGKQKQQNP